jgi:hypothetical protein
MYTLDRLVQVDQSYVVLSAAWVVIWIVVGFMLFFNKEREAPVAKGPALTALHRYVPARKGSGRQSNAARPADRCMRASR